MEAEDLLRQRLVLREGHPERTGAGERLAEELEQRGDPDGVRVDSAERLAQIEDQARSSSRGWRDERPDVRRRRHGLDPVARVLTSTVRPLDTPGGRRCGVSSKSSISS